MNRCIDSLEYFRNLADGDKIANAYPILKDVLTEVLLMHRYSTACEDNTRVIDWDKYEEACVDLNIGNEIWVTNPLFGKIYELANNDEVMKLKKQWIINGNVYSYVYVIDQGKICNTVDYFVDVCRFYDGIVENIR